MQIPYSVRRFVIAASLLFYCAVPFAALAQAEVISRFDARYVIADDGAVVVTERITYDFGTNQKHGIFRDIPLTPENAPQLAITVESVLDNQNKPYRYTSSVSDGTLQIKIGDPNVLVSGVKIYNIVYTVRNAIRDFSDHEEFYWNVTGNAWPVGIGAVSAQVGLRSGYVPTGVQTCFTGPSGGAEKECQWAAHDDSIIYSTTRSLGASEGLTIVYGFPTGTIHNTVVSTEAPRTPQSPLFKMAMGPAGFFFYLSVLIVVLIIRSLLKGKKPKPVIPSELKNRSVVAEYEPPTGLSPIDLGTLFDRRVDPTDISSVILDLAVRGYLKVEYIFEAIPFWPDKKDFKLIKIKDGTDLVHPADTIMFNFLFSGRDAVLLSGLSYEKVKLRKQIELLKKQTEERLFDANYFDRKGRTLWKTVGTVIGWFIFIGFFAVPISRSIPGLKALSSNLIFVFFFAFLIEIAIIGKITHRLTPQGLEALSKILGFKLFLEVTEKDRMKFFNSPEMKPEKFEKYLPYAMVFGVEKEWAQKFEGLYSTNPNWYSSTSAQSFSTIAFVQALGSFNTSFTSVATAASGGSGFSGGSSGGGGGGGGGGSW